MSDTSVTVTALSALEAQANHHLDNVKKSSFEFIECLITIRDSGAWQETPHETYEAYISAVWLPNLDFGYSRLRQLTSAYPVQQIIRDVTGRVLNESQVRSLKSVVPSDKYYMLSEIVTRTMEYTSSPSARHWQATYDVLLQREKTATVNIDGQSVAVDTTQTAVLESVAESDLRMKEHIASNSKWQIVNRYAFTSASDARQAFSTLDELQAIDNDMVITIQVKRRIVDNDDTEVTEIVESE